MRIDARHEPVVERDRVSAGALELRTEAELSSIVPEWRRLCERVRHCTPFQYPEWVLPWYRAYAARDGELRAIVVRAHDASDEIVGLAPLWRYVAADGLRRLALLGTGNTDYVDIVAAPGHETHVLHSVVETLRTMHDWDACDLHPLPGTSPLLALEVPTEWSATTARDGVFPVLRVTGTANPIDDTVPRGLLHRLRSAQRSLARRGRVQIDCADESNALDLLAELYRLHDARWATRGTGGILADARTRRFHVEVAPAMAARGLLRLFVLRVDGRPVAALYGFARAERLYYYLGGFDPAFARESVGSLVILAAIEDGVARGAVEFDFLWGAEPYKYRWGAVDQIGYRVSIRA